MNIDVPFDQIPNIHSEYDDIYIMAVEFDEKHCMKAPIIMKISSIKEKH